MKKIFIVLMCSGLMVACNNAGDTTSTKKDSLDSVAGAEKSMVDSNNNAAKNQLDSSRDQAKASIDSTIDRKKRALDRRDSIHRADSIKAHGK